MPKSYAHLSPVVPPELIQQIREAVRTERYTFAEHAGEQLISRKVSPSEVRPIVLDGVAIEYDDGSGDDPAGVLFNGRTSGGRPLHVKMSERGRGRYVTWVVTVYFPEAKFFEQDFSVRISTKVMKPSKVSRAKRGSR